MYQKTVYVNYNQIAEVVKGFHSLSEITDESLREIKSLNLHMSNLKKVSGKTDSKKDEEKWLAYSANVAIGLMCDRREVVAKLYLDSQVTVK